MMTLMLEKPSDVNKSTRYKHSKAKAWVARQKHDLKGILYLINYKNGYVVSSGMSAKYANVIHYLKLP